ncbi:MAG: lytic murein transglycosylase [Amphiplicatus sp.]
MAASLFAALGTAFAAAGFSAAAAQEPSFEEWLESFRAEAAAAGVRPDVIEDALAGVAPVERVFEINDNQPEFARAIWDYLDGALSAKRIETGRAKLAEHRELLSRIETAYGVDAEILVAIWGLESSYGAVMGDYDVVAALATLAWKGRRSGYGRSQLIGALKILQNGYARRDELKGSWAGAMGQTQFVPTTYLAYAVDFNGDGRRDLWSHLGDVFASTANYLAASGYRADDPWAVEVTLPEGFDYALAEPAYRRALAEWAAMGVRGAQGPLIGRYDPNLRGRVLLPAGASGPAFLVFGNFEAILKYNNSTAYGLAVGLLSQAVAGRDPALVRAWPRDDRALSLSERKALQQALKDHGLDPGPVDGIIGAGTKRALRAWQQREGLPADGYASAKMLSLLTARLPAAENSASQQ